jgi:uncharacterized DUF497 family protein
MMFVYDEQKSIRNEEKHGINFIQAQNIWKDPDCVMIPARTIGESRFLLIGKYNSKVWSAIFTLRDKKIRIISVRRARLNEEEIYRS